MGDGGYEGGSLWLAKSLLYLGSGFCDSLKACSRSYALKIEARGKKKIKTRIVEEMLTSKFYSNLSEPDFRGREFHIHI